MNIERNAVILRLLFGVQVTKCVGDGRVSECFLTRVVVGALYNEHVAVIQLQHMICERIAVILSTLVWRLCRV